MSYHDRNLYETKWGKTDPPKEKESTRPRVQIISPQKMLIDIQSVLDQAREGPMTMFELHESIQNILDGKV